MLFSSPLPRVVVPETPLTPYTLARCGDLPGKAAFIDGLTGQVMTYAELDENVRRQAGGWVERGLVKGDVVSVMAPNCPDFGVVFHSVALAGGVVTTVNPTYTSGEVRRQIDDSGATRMVVAPMLLQTASAATAGSAVSEIFVMGSDDGYPSLSSVAGAPVADQVPVDLDDVVVMPYSSGTTGMSKGVMLTHRNLVSNAEQMLATVEMHEADSFVAVLPFFHIYGMQVLMNVALRAGATIVTMPRFDFERFLSLHQEHRLTCAFVAPPMVLALAKHPIVEKYDLSSLRYVFSGAAPLSAELAGECGKRIGCDVVQGYGMTECSPVTHATPLGVSKPGSVGITVPNTETLIVDPVSGTQLGSDQDGEVWIHGPQVMKGYLNNQEATRATIDAEGWLHTGDIGHFDSEGYLYIVDRLKELIKYKGFQVAPTELEALLLTHPQIADAAVIGLPDLEAGEIPAAYVVVKPGETLDPADVEAYVADKVAHYKRIRKVTVVDAIPKSAAGKILRRVLRDSAESS